MSMLRSKSCHESVSLRIADYLTRDERALAIECIGMGARGQWSNNWARQMDRDRDIYWKTARRSDGSDVTYYHFLVSPDPRDVVDKDTLMSLAQDWAKEFFGDGIDRGSLAMAEYAIVLHDDNENRIPHAHIIVNNLDIETRRRIQIDNKTSRHTMPERLQELSAEYGLHYFGEEEERECPTAQKGRWLTKAERHIEKRGQYSWKQDIRNAIDVARRTSIDAESFVTAFRNLGFDVRKSVDGETIYSHRANPARWSCKARRLGKAYTPEHIQERLSERQARKTERMEQIDRNVQAALVRDFIAGMETAAIVKAGTELKEVSNTLQINSLYNIRCFADYDRAIEELEARVDKEPLRPKDGLLAEIEKVRQAKAVAEKASFFKGVADLPARQKQKEKDKIS